MNDDFAVFILTHGRANNVITYRSLQRAGYTGKVYIIIDNEDKQAPEYYKIYGDKVIMFDKAAIAETFDEGDNFGDRRAVIYARNACFEIARKLGITYFMELDDDYTDIRYKIDSNSEYVNMNWIKSLDNIVDALLRYYISIPAKSIAMSQGGDFIGGKDTSEIHSLNRKRKCMNTFICSVDRPFQFVGRINEDVNTYTWYQGLGNLFMTFWPLAIQQQQTQSTAGGMTDIYIDSGTYIKSFYSVMYLPSSVSVQVMRSHHDERLHHRIDWDTTVPCIVSEELRKAS